MEQRQALLPVLQLLQRRRCSIQRTLASACCRCRLLLLWLLLRLLLLLRLWLLLLLLLRLLLLLLLPLQACILMLLEIVGLLPQHHVGAHDLGLFKADWEQQRLDGHCCCWDDSNPRQASGCMQGLQGCCTSCKEAKVRGSTGHACCSCQQIGCGICCWVGQVGVAW